MSNSAIVKAFIEASAKLRFTFEPFCTLEYTAGDPVRSIGLVKAFGAPQGTLLFVDGDEPNEAQQNQLTDLGYYFSILFPVYEKFDEQLFQDTLSDWGFYGQKHEPAPTWYSGVSYK
jgi:hypothetical protein